MCTLIIRVSQEGPRSCLRLLVRLSLQPALWVSFYEDDMLRFLLRSLDILWCKMLCIPTQPSRGKSSQDYRDIPLNTANPIWGEHFIVLGLIAQICKSVLGVYSTSLRCEKTINMYNTENRGFHTDDIFMFLFITIFLFVSQVQILWSEAYEFNFLLLIIRHIKPFFESKK
jgi:hypothetical protein